jgi:hypothetical protein
MHETRSRSLAGAPPDDLPTASCLERACYNTAIDMCRREGVVPEWGSPFFEACYKALSTQMRRNLPVLKELCGAGVDPAVAILTPSWEMYPEVWEKELRVNAMRNISYGDTPKPNTCVFACPRCKSRECRYFELQTRGADEPSTMFVLCTACGKRWRC